MTSRRFADLGVGAAYDAGDHDRLLVLFGSRLGGVVAGQTPWGFVRSSDGLAASRLFLRDHARAWYTRGVREFGSVDAVASLIRLLADGHRQTVLFGASMGGYGALLYARLAGLDAVAINPQTSTELGYLNEIRDYRWSEDLVSLLQAGPVIADGDLATLPHLGGTLRLIYATGQPLDVAHAERMAGPGVVLDPRDSDAHDLARHLAASGELAELLNGHTPVPA